MARTFHLQTDLEHVDSEAIYHSKAVVDAAGIDLYYLDEEVVDSSLSLEGVDRFDFAYAVLGDEPGDQPTGQFYWQLYSDWSDPEEITDKQLEEIAHVALRILNERKCA